MNIPLKKFHIKQWTKSFAFGLAIFLTACVSVDPAPFTQFAKSLGPLRDAVDSQAAVATNQSRKELIKKITDGELDLADLQLDFPSPDNFTSAYTFAEDGEPNFAKFRRMRLGLSALNDAMITYARSLEMLAGGSETGDILPTTAEFDKMAQDLNAHSGTAASALKINIDPGKQALLSTAAIQLFKAYIESKRREYLVEAITDVQPRVEEFSTLAQQAVGLLAEIVKTDYLKRILPLMASSPPNADSILTFNDVTQASLATLQSMSNSYRALPAAHRDLIAAANKKSTGLGGLIALSEEATRLQGLVKQLTEANEAVNAAAATQ